MEFSCWLGGLQGFTFFCIALVCMFFFYFKPLRELKY